MKHLQATVFLALSMATANAAAITYHVDRTIQNSTITGIIETNGDTGSDFDIAADIVSWSLALTVNDATTGDLIFTDSIDSTTGTMMVGGNAVSASADGTRLIYDFTIDASNFLLFRNDALNFWCLETRNCSTGTDFSEQIGHIVSGNDQIFAIEDRTGQIITFAAVPVPAAIWLFGSGLLGLLGLARIRR